MSRIRTTVGASRTVGHCKHVGKVIEPLRWTLSLVLLAGLLAAQTGCAPAAVRVDGSVPASTADALERAVTDPGTQLAQMPNSAVTPSHTPVAYRNAVDVEPGSAKPTIQDLPSIDGATGMADVAVFRSTKPDGGMATGGSGSPWISGQEGPGKGQAYTWNDGDRTLTALLQPDLTLRREKGDPISGLGPAVAGRWRIAEKADGATGAVGATGGGGDDLPVFRSRSVALMTLPRGVAVQASDAQLEPCPGGGYNPTPTAVDVEAVPIKVESTAADYFVLYVRHDVDGAEVELPVLVQKGAAGMTTLAENVAALPKERYRVEKYLVTDPADVDGDCIDDLTELGNPAGMNPVNAAAAVPLSDGAVAIPDRHTFETLAEAGRYVKFLVFGLDSGSPRVYFINTNTHTLHGGFLQALTALGIEESDADDRHNGVLTYHPELQSADGSPGVYSVWIYRLEPFAVNDLLYTLFAANMPLLDDNFAYHLREQWRLAYNDEPLYEASRINLLLDEDVAPESDFIPMNKAVGYGMLRAMGLEDSPNPRDVVIYEALPNELSRVAGIITTVAQTPLSHVNLRAVQDGVPNAFIRGAVDKPEINALIGHYVQYTVTTDGYAIRAATKPEIDNHYASSRPAAAQTPQRDLSVTEITPLSGIRFDDWDAFGVKAANVAVLRTLDFPEGTVPDGFAIPFYFYDEFMKHNNFYAGIETMLADPDFQSNFDTQEDELKDLRDDIEDADTPAWIVTALATMNESFPDGINRRYRSSTNNEDLPGFSGAGLYDSKSQKPSEDTRMTWPSPSRRSTPACGTSVPSSNAISIALTTWRRQWESSSIPVTKTKRSTASPSASTS